MSDIEKMMNQVATKMSFEVIRKEIKPIQEELNKVIEKHQGIGGGMLNTQAIILNSFFPTEKLILNKEEGKDEHYSDLDSFLNSIPEEEKKKLYDETMALFLNQLSSKEGGNS